MTGRKKSVSRKKSGGRQKQGERRQSSPINQADSNLAQAKNLGLELRAKEAILQKGIQEKDHALIMIMEDERTVSSDLRTLAKLAFETNIDARFKDKILNMYVYGDLPMYKNPRMDMDAKRHELKHNLKRVWEDRFGWGGAVDEGLYIYISGRRLADGRMSLKVTWNNAIAELKEAGTDNPIPRELEWMSDAVERYSRLTFGDVEIVEKKHDYDDFYVKVIVPETTR